MNPIKSPSLLSSSCRAALCGGGLIFLLVPLSFGCNPGDGSPVVDLDGDGIPDELPPGTLDLRREYPVPEGDNILVVEMQDLLVEPGGESFFCLFETWDGDDVGIVSMTPYHTPEFHHHSLLKAVTEPDYEPPVHGEVMDCSSQTELGDPRPLFSNVGYDPENPQDWVTLPEGIAFPLRAGQLFFGDTHYINTTDDHVLVNAVFVIEYIPAAEVEGYAGSFVHDWAGLEVPPNGDYHLQFNCNWESQVTVLSLAGHMHNYGTAYSIDWNSGVGSEEVYSVPEWQPDYQFGSPLLSWEPGEFVVEAGDSFTTHCSWLNPHDKALGFPHEMCTTFGVGYPLDESIQCYGEATR